MKQSNALSLPKDWEIRNMNKNSIMKNEWGISDFDNCLEKVKYTNKIQRKDFKEQGNFPIISQEQEFVNGYWDDEKDLFRIEKPVVIFGDHTKVIKFVDFDFVLGADGVKIFKTKKHIVPKYLYYYLQNIELETLGYARHYRLFKEKMIKYPKSLPEQHRIVSILDESFAAIDKAKENAKRNLRNAKEVFKSYLQGVFENKGKGWEEKRVEEICTLINGKAYKRDELLAIGKYRVLRVGNFFTNDHWYYSDLELDESKYCDKEDLLYAWSASFGPRIWNEEKVIYHYHIWKVIPDGKLVTRDFLFTLFEWDKEKIKEEQGTGTTMIHVSKGSMEKRLVPLPPIQEQHRIVHQLDVLRAETQKLEAVYQNKIDNFAELKKSILGKAFAGELSERVIEKTKMYEL